MTCHWKRRQHFGSRRAWVEQQVEWVICFCCNGSKKIEDDDGFCIQCDECNENGMMPWTAEDEERYAAL